VSNVTTTSNFEVPAPPPIEDAMRDAVGDCLAAAETWLGWNGQTQVGLGSVWTPNKVLRRVADHFVDHLAQIEALLAGVQAPEIHWLGRAVTLDSDWGRFSESDLREARARIERLGAIFVLRVRALDADEYRRPRDDSWTIAEITDHVIEGIAEYTAQFGSTSASFEAKS
jgi:hypothetical protein